MNSRNMLSVNKVKLHGMTSTKWTTKDKITQYKGLISLYTRDKKIIDMDTIIAQKRNNKEIKNIQKEIEQNRRDLDNACGGDKQQLRNTLALDKELQMAFSHAKPEQVIDMVVQLKFTKRKMKDMLKYRMKQKAEELIDLKLKYAFYEDRLKFESYSWEAMLPTEKEATLVTGKVQDAILKKEAAIYIRNAYREMIAIMKKDAIYFDAILVSIKEDQQSQGKCLLNATKMGQLGTEYLDDRRQEYQALEKVVKEDIVNRKKDLADVQQNVQNLANSLKNLLRRDSDINLGKVEIEKTESYINLTDELFTIETTLTSLKNSIFTPTIESIYPCIQEQYRQKDRLTEFLDQCNKDRAELTKRYNHAKAMHSQLLNTMVDTTSTYNVEKLELNQKIAEEKENKVQLEILIKNRYSLLANVRISLRHLQYLSRLMSIPGQDSRVKFIPKKKVDVKDMMPLPDEADATKIIPELITRFTRLTTGTKEILTGKTKEDGYQTFERMMITRTKPVQVDVVMSEESLIETVFTDSNILSRADIKRQSEEIVAANMVSDDAPVEPRKGKIKFR